jgi:hypothetical protein
MASYLNHDYGWTIGAHADIGPYEISWENIPGTGPNHGLVMFTASPLPGQQGEIKLTTYNVTKARRRNGPVFYQFRIRSDSEIDARFSVEIVWGVHDEAASVEKPW